MVEEVAMKRCLSFLMTFILCSLPLTAADDEKEEQRLHNCGTVLKEVLDVPENIPRDLLDKAEYSDGQSHLQRRAASWQRHSLR